MSSEVTAKVCELIGLSSLSEPSVAKSFFLEGCGKWTSIPKRCRSLRPEERFLEVELKLETPLRIRGIHVGNYWSAFLSVSCSQGLQAPSPLLSSKMLLSRQDSVIGKTGEGVIFFQESSFKATCCGLVDRVQIKVSQPYNIPSDKFGLSMFVLRGTSSLISDRKEPIHRLNNRNLSPSAEMNNNNTIDSLIAKAGKHILPTSNKKHHRESLASSLGIKPKLDIQNGESSPAKDLDLHRLARQILKSLPLNSSCSQLLQVFHERNPHIRLSVQEKDRLKQEFQQHCSSPKRKRRPDCSQEAGVHPKKAKEEFDPSIFKAFSKEELLHNKVLVQTRIYKKDKELPLKENGVIFVEKGVPVNFYKTGEDIYMEVESVFYRPEVRKEHLASIFKDYSEREIHSHQGEEEKENKQAVPVITLKDDAHLCPVCNEAEFFSVRDLEAHCWSCTGPHQDTGELQALLSELNEPTPGPSGLQKMNWS